MNEAIKLAKEQGYKPLKLWGTETELYSDMFIDPSFWQALGRALGWKEHDNLIGIIHPHWLYKWHRFIDWIAEGKSPDSFFEELIKKQWTTNKFTNEAEVKKM